MILFGNFQADCQRYCEHLIVRQTPADNDGKVLLSIKVHSFRICHYYGKKRNKSSCRERSEIYYHLWDGTRLVMDGRKVPWETCECRETQIERRQQHKNKMCIVAQRDAFMV